MYIILMKTLINTKAHPLNRKNTNQAKWSILSMSLLIFLIPHRLFGAEHREHFLSIIIEVIEIF
jgi:hypothetical protein